MLGTSAVHERYCTVLMHYDKATPPNEDEIREELEAKEVERKVSGLQTLISLLLNGEVMPKLLMTVIRFCVPCDDHKIKKLLLVYWEVVEKTGPDGKLLPEMILVTNNLRNDLVHANEYIRGCTLRFLCKLKEAEILEPLIPMVKNNLEHRHAFVRRNAVLAVHAIYKAFDHLLPDGPELVEKVLVAEADPSCKRNAFLMLFQSDQERAVAFLSDNLDQVAGYGDTLQLVILELIRKVVRANPLDKSKYIRCILTLFTSSSSAVVYECASALITLSSSVTAIRAAANSYTQLLASQSDNNIKLIVLERLADLKRQHPKVVTELIMDILRALSSANLDIRKKTLDITLDLVTPQTIAEVMQVLKKEVSKTAGEDGEKNAEYRAMLITSIHKSTTKFPDAVSTVVPILMDFLGDANQASAVDVILFVREIVETYPHLRETIIRKLLGTFAAIHSSRVARVALWLIGEYCTETADVALAFTTIKQALGELPFAAPAEDEAAGAEGAGAGAAAPPPPPQQGRPVVLADGTYGHQSAIAEDAASAASGAAAPAEAGSKLRALLVGGDYFLSTVVATTLTKLALRSRAHVPPVTANLVAADVMLILTGMLQLGQAGRGVPPIDADSQERISVYLQVLSDPTEEMQHLCLVHCREAFSAMLSERLAAEAADAPKVRELIARRPEPRARAPRAHPSRAPRARRAPLRSPHRTARVPQVTSEVDLNNRQADDLISVRQLKGRAADTTMIDLDDDDDAALSKATGASQTEDFSQRLKRVTQLTGLSDPVYAEAYVTVHSYDIMLDLLVINQTAEPMYNLCLELATVGDLKLCERPQSYTLAPGEQKHVKANIKVSSTETGIVFGTIVYDNTPGTGAGSVAAVADRNCVVLNDIHIDIMDYIAPASCSDLTFRAMWAEFEWENKVAVNTDITEVNAFLEHVVKTTNMKCLTPTCARAGSRTHATRGSQRALAAPCSTERRRGIGRACCRAPIPPRPLLTPRSADRTLCAHRSALEGDSGFLAANLYAKSIFGEDALVNVSVEKRSDGKICGYIRIRSKTQGIALSLGDKITLKQKAASLSS